MTTLADARAAVANAISKISEQRMDPATTSEQLTALYAALNTLLPKLHQIEIAGLDEAANAVAAAVTGLQAVIDDAKLDTLSQLKQQLGALAAKLDQHHADTFAATKLVRTGDPAPAAPLPQPTVVPVPRTAPAQAASQSPAPAVLPSGFKLSTSTKLDDLQGEYRLLYATCVIDPSRETIVQGQAAKLLSGRARYEGIAADTPGMPWYLVGIIHGMEAGYRFTSHLHNGDPLTARTINVPAGRPPTGTPPFTWEQSARDALQFEGLTGETNFSIAHLLYFFEKYNGFGYRSHDVPSPYLWGFSNHYTSGKFVADHVFSPTAVSGQVGAAVLVKELEKQHIAII
jgi:lysozyme family protein